MNINEAKAIAYSDDWHYVDDELTGDEICLEGHFTVERLKAIVYLMEHGFFDKVPESA